MRALAIPVLCLTVGCGATFAERAEAIHEVLNAVTDVVDPAYALTLEVCGTRAQAIVDRADTTQEQDETDLRQLRERCAAANAGFESLREVQLALRAAVDAARAQNTEAAFVQILRRLEALKAGWDNIRESLEAAGILGGDDG